MRKSYNLYEISMEYDLRKNIYNLNEQKCRNLRDLTQIIAKLFPMAFSIYVQIPYRMLPKSFGKMAEVSMKAKDVLDSMVIGSDILRGTFQALVWESRGRREYEDRMAELRKQSQDLRAEYRTMQADFKIIIEQLNYTWNSTSEAFFMLNRSSNSNITKIKLAELTKSYAILQLINQGFLFSIQNNYFDAIKLFDEAIRIDPQDADAWFGKGVVLYRQGQISEAIKAYDKVTKINRNHSLAWNNKGLALGDFGKYNEALACLEEAIRINPESADIWYNKGVILRGSSNNAGAEVAFDKAKELVNKARK